MAALKENDLYAPVRKLPEEQGYTVRGDSITAIWWPGETRVIVELKSVLSLGYQASSASAPHMPSVWPLPH
jgi:hypothetical protein